MTTSVKPLPAHGTYARANGAPGYREPCKCKTCWTAHRRARKQYTVNRALGRPGLIDASPARKHLNQLTPTMTWGQICEATALDAGNLQRIADGRRAQIRRETHKRIMVVKPQAPAPGKYVDATGLRRRLQALRAIGWSAQILADKADSAEVRIQRICSDGQPTVRQVLAEKILKLYAELSQAPAPVGRSATRAKNHAIANQWAPPGAWDDDQIDDPTAVPDWTGHCGSDRGYWMHRNQKLPMCARCETAHQEWLAERAHLTPQQLNREKFGARSAAASREADLAHDARELMRYGVDTEQAAARLRVTRQHLQQALLRHPEDTTPQQDDMGAAA